MRKRERYFRSFCHNLETLPSQRNFQTKFEMENLQSKNISLQKYATTYERFLHTKKDFAFIKNTILHFPCVK